MKLLERVADTCWGYAYAWYDVNKDGKIDEGEKVKLSTLEGLGENGCQGGNAEIALMKYFNDRFKNAPLTEDDVKVNTKSDTLIKSNS